MKKAHLSPVTSLLVSSSLVLGILVSDLCGYRLLTVAHAGDTCATQDKKVSSKRVKVTSGLALGGVNVRGIIVNGQLIDHGVIASRVLLSDMTAPNARGVLVGDDAATPSTATSGEGSLCKDGVLVGDGSPSPASLTGVLVGDDSQTSLNGVLVGDGSPGVLVGDGSPVTTTGVLVGDELLSEDITVGDAVISVKGIASGGVLVGDGITIVDGVITGQNLVLFGTTIKGGAVNILGSVTEVQVSPVN